MHIANLSVLEDSSLSLRMTKKALFKTIIPVYQQC